MAEAIEEKPFSGSVKTSGQFAVTHTSVMGREGTERNPENVAKSWQRASPPSVSRRDEGVGSLSAVSSPPPPPPPTGPPAPPRPRTAPPPSGVPPRGPPA